VQADKPDKHCDGGVPALFIMKYKTVNSVQAQFKDLTADLETQLVGHAKKWNRKSGLLSFGPMAYCHVTFQNGSPAFEINLLSDQFGELDEEVQLDIPYSYKIKATYDRKQKVFVLSTVEIDYIAYYQDERSRCKLSTPETTTNPRLIAIIEKKFNNNFNLSSDQEKTYMLLNGHRCRGELMKGVLEDVFECFQKFVDLDARRAKRNRVFACTFGFWIHPSMIDTKSQFQIVISSMFNGMVSFSMFKIYLGLLIMWLV